jgi:peptide/nickel transport system substrate-binding protein
MSGRRAIALALLMLAVIAAAGCGGGSSNDNGTGGGGGGSGTVKQGGIFTEGTTNYIDTLNPFNYIEAQSVTAFLEIYPTLVQYGPGLTDIVPNYATSWDTSSDGKTWTYHLHSGGKWSDGKPLTADDVAWTANTIVKFQNGPTAVLASAVAHVTKVDAPDPNTVVFHYDAPVGNALNQISGLYVLPKHIWAQYATGNGKALKTFLPEQHLPVVSGGPFQATQYEKKGTSVFKPNPGFWGPKPHVDAVALVYYTNADSMIADLQSGQISAVDQVPFTAVNAVKKVSNVHVDTYPGGEIVNITWNSNPYKPQHRELLNPEVKKALTMCVDVDQIKQVVFSGYAAPEASLLGTIAGDWRSPNVKPVPFNCDEANKTLDSLGYKKGSDGIRVVPATTGKDAEPAHKMEYQIMVPTSLDFNGDREFDIIQQGFANAGVKVTEQSGGDATAAYAIETDNTCDGTKNPPVGYSKFDIALWDWVAGPDPDFQLSVVTRAQWCSWSDTGWINADYDKMYQQQATLVDEAQRKTLVHKMDEIIFNNWLYSQLLNEVGIAAHTDQWDGFDAQMQGWNFSFWTDVHQA